MYFFGVLLLWFPFHLGTIPIFTGSNIDIFEREVKTWTKSSRTISVERAAQQNKAMDKERNKMLLAWTGRWQGKSRRRESRQAQGRISPQDRCPPLAWLGQLLCSGWGGSQEESERSTGISNVEFQAGLGCDAFCTQINTFSSAE